MLLFEHGEFMLMVIVCFITKIFVPTKSHVESANPWLFFVEKKSLTKTEARVLNPEI